VSPRAGHESAVDESGMQHASHLSTRISLRTRIIAVAIATALLLASTIASATADPPEFNGGTSVPTIGDFNPVVLNGTDQLTSATITPFVITDTSGTLAGWNVTLQIPSFQNGTGGDCSVGATASIAGTNVTMDAPLVTSGDGTTSMTGVTSAGFSDFTAPRTIIDAAIGDGAGTYDVTPGIVRLVVPANSLVGSYCTQATITINSGP
jgi:hypothetical protein